MYPEIVPDHPAPRRRASEAAAINHVIDRLTKQFPELDPERIAQLVNGKYKEYDESKIRDFLPILVERSTRQSLAAEATEATPRASNGTTVDQGLQRD
jgi:hypothetical protein